MTLDWSFLLPLIFASLMGVAILVYVVLDGFDLGIGILFTLAQDDDKDTMVNAIGPFWDANETWLVLAVGLLLVAFPAAHGVILSALYIPVFLLLVGLILTLGSAATPCTGSPVFAFSTMTLSGSSRSWSKPAN